MSDIKRKCVCHKNDIVVKTNPHTTTRSRLAVTSDVSDEMQFKNLKVQYKHKAQHKTQRSILYFES